MNKVLKKDTEVLLIRNEKYKVRKRFMNIIIKKNE